MDLKNVYNFASPRVESIKEINKIIGQQTRGHYFIDQDEIFCGERNLCKLFTTENKPISIDGEHLTEDGALFLGKKLLSHPILQKIADVKKKN